MRKISALVAHLHAATGLPLENIHAYADKGELAPSGRHLGSVMPTGDGPAREQVEIGVWKYDAVIQIERYSGDGPALMAIVLAWLSEASGLTPWSTLTLASGSSPRWQPTSQRWRP